MGRSRRFLVWVPESIELTERPGEENGDLCVGLCELERHPSRNGQQAVGNAALVYKRGASMETEIHESPHMGGSCSHPGRV